MPRRVAAALVTCGLVALAGLLPTAATAARPVQAPSFDPDSCKREPGADAPRSTWALQRLDLARTSSLATGQDVRTGQGVPIAVVDSGFDRTNPQLRGADAAPVRSAMRSDPGRAYNDCIGHGTRVAAIIVAQPDQQHPDFVGVAPRARLVPIKVTNGESVATADVARGIELAVRSRVKIINVSIALPVDDPGLRAAVRQARDAGILVVAAAGNDQQDANASPVYPAAYARQFDNVIAVAAMKQDNTIAAYSSERSDVGIAAPGDAVQSVALNGGYLVVSGTSYAAPFVSGVAALVLGAHPELTAAQLRSRLEATAEAPPATVPSPSWGYGVLDPYLAVTTLRADLPTGAASSSRPAPVAAPPPPAAADHSTRNRTLVVAFSLFGLTALVMTAAGVWRGRHGRHGSLTPPTTG